MVLLLIVLALMFIGVFIVQRSYQRRKMLEILDSVRQEREYIFDKILELKSKSLETFVYDYTFWDEMVDFAAAPNNKWGYENIDVSLVTYGADAAWVYNTDQKLIYSVNRSDKDDGLKELPIPKEVLADLFLVSPFCHFFIDNQQGLTEIWGATIHGSSDLKRETPAQGYFFCSRRWTQELVAELSQLTDSKVVLIDILTNKQSLSLRDSVEFSRPLLGWDGQPLKYFFISSVSKAILASKKLALQTTALFISFSLLIVLIVSFFIFRWVNIPLKLINQALKNKDSKFLNKIKMQKTEFGEVTQMIDSFFAQREAILLEISQRKRQQEALSKVNSCFTSFVADPSKNIRIITETAGQILGATFLTYNCNHAGRIVTDDVWNKPVDFSISDLGQGHLGFDLIKNQSNQLVVIEDLAHTNYAQTDPSVKKYKLQIFIGCPIRIGDRTVASLGAFFVSPAKIEAPYLNLFQVLGKALSIEEERKHMDEEAKNQALKLDNALKEALKSREVLLSMLEDNHLNKERLEQNVQELAGAYSKLKESQEELLQAAKFGAIGQLASSVAHEVRNPLAIVMQSIDYLESRISDEDKEIIQVAKNNIKRANTIVSTLLDFSKVKKLNIMPEDINSIVNDSLVLTRYSNLKDRVKIVKELAEDLPRVLVDRQKIEQVLVNLNLNAIQAMPHGGNLYLRTYLTKFNRLSEESASRPAGSSLSIQKSVTIEVEDEGTGISEENLKNLFRPFFTTKGETLGVGLGLSVARDIIAMHNGQIEIKSKVNQGTKVIVTLGVERGEQ